MNSVEFLMDKYNISCKAIELVNDAELALKDIFNYYDDISEYNTYKVADAFRKCNVQSRYFYGSTGYGYADDGRDKLSELFSSIFNTVV